VFNNLTSRRSHRKKKEWRNTINSIPLRFRLRDLFTLAVHAHALTHTHTCTRTPVHTAPNPHKGTDIDIDTDIDKDTHVGAVTADHEIGNLISCDLSLFFARMRLCTRSLSS